MWTNNIGHNGLTQGQFHWDNLIFDGLNFFQKACSCSLWPRKLRSWLAPLLALLLLISRDIPTSGASFTVPYHSSALWSPLLNTHHLKTELPPLEFIPLCLTVRSSSEKPAKKKIDSPTYCKQYSLTTKPRYLGKFTSVFPERVLCLSMIPHH